MSLFENTLDALIRQTFILCLGNWWDGTATGGGAGTLIDTANRGEPDGFFSNLNARIKIITTTDDAAPKGDERPVTNFTQSTSTITVAPNFAANAGSGDTYAIYAGWSWTEVKEAINAAIDRYAVHALIDKVDESVQLESGVYEYTLPSGLIYLTRVSVGDGVNDFPDAIPPDQYRVVRGGTQPMLKFIKFPAEGKHEGHLYSSHFADDYITDNRLLRIEGFGRQARLSKDTDTCRIDPNLICFQAAALLHARKSMRSDVDPDEHRVQMAIWQAQADGISGGAPYYPALKRTITPDMKRVE